MISFKYFINNLSEAVATNKKPTKDNTGVHNLEHGFAHIHNHLADNPHLLGNHDGHHAHIEAAKLDRHHPLNYRNAKASEFGKGVKTRKSSASYYKSLHNNVAAIHDLHKHPSFKGVLSSGAKARVVGNEKGSLSDTYRNAGATNSSSKSDVEIGNHGEKHHHSISLKHGGDAHLMSSQTKETHAIYDHATSRHMKEKNSGFTKAHKSLVMSHIKSIGEHMDKAKSSTNEAEATHHIRQANTKLREIHTMHPGLLKHVAHEAATGEGKFGKGQHGTARHVVTVTNSGAHIHDTQTNHQPIDVQHPSIGKRTDKGTTRVVTRMKYKTKK